ncbi:hypothetical protein E3N88_28553 [Mikania micrantha]|uniref:Protein kinase domain-containing protein n=1 Tax=Mikania micrantha TaxID=192012 RepID=A0A5N6N2Q8_9ASTR|nr:hypothetical protein E3N88_28553 [Mikania micrantha]
MTDFEEKLAHFRIPLADLKTATNNFAEENLLKRGYNSDFYEAKLQLWSKVVTGRDVVIQNLYRFPFQFPHDFNEWIEKLISGLKHKKFVCFIGFCDEEGEKMIVMERVVNGSLHRCVSTLTCLQRLELCFDAAVALQDWREANGYYTRYMYGIGFKIMLDKDWKAKILLSFEPDTKNSVGYSFGKMLLEVLYGRKVTNEDVIQVKEGYDIIDNIDPNLNKEMIPDSLSLFSKVIINCFKDPEDHLYISIPGLKEAHEIQWKHENPNPLEKIKHLKIPLNKIKSATADFSRRYMWHRDVYKAELGEQPKKKVFIKRIRKKKNILKASFIQKIEMLAHFKHPSNQVLFLGFCDEESEMILVFEYTFKENLEYYWDTGCSWAVNVSVNSHDLTWQQRIWICLDIAHGLQLSAMNSIGELFEIHPKYSAFLQEHKRLGLSDDDIYLFGVFLFEILTASCNYLQLQEMFSSGIASITRLKDLADLRIRKEDMCLVPIARTHFINGTLKEILDAELMEEAFELGLTLKVRPDQDSLDVFSKIAYQCLSRSQDKRPKIQAVIQDLKKALQLQENRMTTDKFSLEDIKRGTNNFSDDKCILKEGHEMLYEGTIQDPNGHTNINVLLKRFFNQERGFLKEFEVLFKYKHDNIIGLVGYSKEMDERIIVYEHALKGCLNRYLKDTSFSWIQRLKVCIDIARGLKFLHEGDVGQDVVIHRDIKSSNILLTTDWKAKIYGFKDAPNDVVGSAAYLDPSYYHTNDLTKESDIYSFGVVLFEILCGRMAFPEENSDNKKMLDCLVKSRHREARVEEIVFEELKKHIVQKSFTTFRRIAFKCLHENSEERPRAGDVLEELQKALKFQEEYEERKAKLNRIYTEILDQVPKSGKELAIYKILSKEFLHEDDKLVLGSFSFVIDESFSTFKQY